MISVEDLLKRYRPGQCWAIEPTALTEIVDSRQVTINITHVYLLLLEMFKNSTWAVENTSLTVAIYALDELARGNPTQNLRVWKSFPTSFLQDHVPGKDVSIDLLIKMLSKSTSRMSHDWATIIAQHRNDFK